MAASTLTHVRLYLYHMAQKSLILLDVLKLYRKSNKTKRSYFLQDPATKIGLLLLSIFFFITTSVSKIANTVNTRCAVA